MPIIRWTSPRFPELARVQRILNNRHRKMPQLSHALLGVITMKPKVEIRMVRELKVAISDFWRPHCFVYGEKHTWIRRWGWKTDMIHVVHTKNWHIHVNFCVHLPPKALNGVYQDIGSTSLGMLAGREIEQSFPFPRFPWMTQRYVPNITRLMPLAVSWFGRFDTSPKCLDELSGAPYVNHDSPMFRYCQQYLQTLADEAARGCCLLNFEIEHYDEYCRSLFDVHWRGPLGRMKDDVPEPQI